MLFELLPAKGRDSQTKPTSHNAEDIVKRIKMLTIANMSDLRNDFIDILLSVRFGDESNLVLLLSHKHTHHPFLWVDYVHSRARAAAEGEQFGFHRLGAPTTGAQMGKDKCAGWRIIALYGANLDFNK